jgi:Protein of unknown function (DUF1326)
MPRSKSVPKETRRVCSYARSGKFGLEKEQGMKPILLFVLVLMLAVSLTAAPGEPLWRMKADYVEACSCHLFCQCYFSDRHGHKHAEYPSCEFNMAVNVREGHSGNIDLGDAKYWLTGDLGDKWGTEKKAKWVTVSFDPKTTKAQRDALAPIILKTYGLDWGELKVQEAPIEIRQSGDLVEAKLADGKQAYLKLQREPGIDGKGVVIRNVPYFEAVQNDGFQLFKSIEHRADLSGHQFSYSDRNAFLITIVSQDPGTRDTK